MTPAQQQQARVGAADAVSPHMTIPDEGLRYFRPHWTVADAVAALGGNPRSHVTNPDWLEDANCAGADTDMFFPDWGGSRWASGKAKAICQACEVRPECLAAAMNNGERYGIFGGLNRHERNRLRRGVVADTRINRGAEFAGLVIEIDRLTHRKNEEGVA